MEASNEGISTKVLEEPMNECKCNKSIASIDCLQCEDHISGDRILCKPHENEYYVKEKHYSKFFVAYYKAIKVIQEQVTIYNKYSNYPISDEEYLSEKNLLMLHESSIFPIIDDIISDKAGEDHIYKAIEYEMDLLNDIFFEKYYEKNP